MPLYVSYSLNGRNRMKPNGNATSLSMNRFSVLCVIAAPSRHCIAMRFTSSTTDRFVSLKRRFMLFDTGIFRPAIVRASRSASVAIP